MEPATVLSISLGLCLVAIAGFSIYTSFGPPSKELRDPFEEHED
ncbi:photosystem II reaction center protein PsbN [Kamptonema animale CS-326]|jgi:PsbN protein|nr:MULTISPECIES: photosystem II reaction center protein PsbN [Kamptonema]MDB9511499.1 photosystem II reaction center protein PsbN [Kamptonema animale CS-326]MDF0551778.1 photosystem II reaction center protein PsbN [Kamptonema sp. UHCC 0994]